MNFSEDSHTLAEFYPDARQRIQVHYAFAHQFLPRYAHDAPFRFVRHDGNDDVSRFLQARWQMFERLAGLQPRLNSLEALVFRRVTDLNAWAQDVADHPAVFVQMPTPEESPCAFFATAVLLAPRAAFKTADEAIKRQILDCGPQPDQALLAPLHAAPCHFYTLERMSHLQGAEALQTGVLCGWVRDSTHLNMSLLLPATREAFAEAVAQTVARSETGPALPGHSPLPQPPPTSTP